MHSYNQFDKYFTFYFDNIQTILKVCKFDSAYKTKVLQIEAGM